MRDLAKTCPECGLKFGLGYDALCDCGYDFLERTASVGILEQARMTDTILHGWNTKLNYLMNIWIWSELLVLLFNKRKRAIHDFIGGTVVIYRDKQPVISGTAPDHKSESAE